MAKHSRIPLLLATAGLLALPLAACEIDDDGNGLTDNGGTPDAAGDVQDTTEEQQFAGVLVQDLWNPDTCGEPDQAGCCGSQHEAKMAPGADIDAVELIAGSDILGTFEFVASETNPTGSDVCSANAYDDPDAAKGAPDATQAFPEPAGTGYFALHGGWIAGEFTGGVFVQAGDQIKVWELGQSHDLANDGTDEPYEVHLVETIGCNPRDGMTGCSFMLSDQAVGTATITATGF
ncbi:MAG: hypothetical protein ACQEXJ_00430 [Myxococcota bacterium]